MFSANFGVDVIPGKELLLFWGNLWCLVLRYFSYWTALEIIWFVQLRVNQQGIFREPDHVGQVWSGAPDHAG